MSFFDFFSQFFQFQLQWRYTQCDIKCRYASTIWFWSKRARLCKCTYTLFGKFCIKSAYTYLKICATVRFGIVTWKSKIKKVFFLSHVGYSFEMKTIWPYPLGFPLVNLPVCTVSLNYSANVKEIIHSLKKLYSTDVLWKGRKVKQLQLRECATTKMYCIKIYSFSNLVNL